MDTEQSQQTAGPNDILVTSLVPQDANLGSAVTQSAAALVMSLVSRFGPTTLARLSVAGGLSKQEVAAAVDALMDGGLLAEVSADTVPDGRASSARQATRITLSPWGPMGIGLEIRTDRLLAVDVDLTGVVRHHEMILGDQRRSQVGTVLARAAMVLGRVFERVRLDGCPVAGVAVAVPGAVDSRRQILRQSTGLGWHDVDVIAELRVRAEGTLDDVPIVLDNEANLCALAELWRGGHVDSDLLPMTSFFHVVCDIGVRSAIVLEGALYRGRNGFGGELGHLSVPIDGLPRGVANRFRDPCDCGQLHCLERFVGLGTLLRLAQLDRVEDLEAAARAGRRDVLAILEFAGATLGRAIGGVLNVLDLDSVVVQGTPAQFSEWMLPPLRAELDRSVVTAQVQAIAVRSGALGPGGGAIGGAESVVRDVLVDPLQRHAS